MFVGPIKTLTDQDSDCYDLSGGNKLAVIFNYETFNDNQMQPVRAGTQKDCDAIKKAFNDLGFQVKQHDNLKV